VVARLFPVNQRTLAIGIFQSGLSVGALVAPPVIIWLTRTWNWRAAFVVCGGLGLVWAATWIACFRLGPGSQLNESPEAEQDRGSAGAIESTPANLREILRSRAFWGLVIAAIFLNPLQYFYVTWVPRYFDKYAGVGFGKELAARLVVVYLFLDLGFCLGGGLVSWLASRIGATRARLAVTAGGALCMSAIPIVTQLQDLNAITAFLCAATFGSGCCIVNYLAFVSELSSKRISTSAGLLGGLGSLAGAGFMLLIGGTIEHNHSFRVAFFITGVMPFAGFAGLWLSTRRPGRNLAAGAPDLSSG
jgi:ACS family hexuronate transporter-like MFS transporter